MKNLIMIFGITVLTLLSCKKKEEPQGPQGPPGPSLSGNLVGYVDVYDSYGALQKLDSVLVNVTGRSAGSLTDTLGKFTITNLTTGTYELNFSKPNYQSTKIPSLNFVGGGTQYISNRIAITQAPSFTISNLGFSNVFGTISYTITASASDVKARKVIMFLSKNSNVSSSPSSYAGSLIANIAAGSTNAIGTISASTLSQLGFNSGDVVYAIVYPISNANNASVYFDVNSGKMFYNNINTLGASPVVNFMVP
ncbi:MAG: carboxypeptidase-like regulatory domain-containing protein [Bacteroidia bacterium]|nr:carboxypeptidase-like regulatory domain-containing protein [Bacteroidia bacterium]